MAERIRILYDGKLALTVAQAARRYDNIAPDAMRQAIYRLKKRGLIAELPETVEGRPIYLASALDKAMKTRPGKGGRNVQPRRRKATAVPPQRPPADYVSYGQRKPYTVADSLDTLTGPTSGVIELPHHINWSGTPQRDLGEPGVLASTYETVLNEASTVADLETWLNRNELIELWPALWLPPRVRQLWDDRFPELAAASPTIPRTANTKGNSHG